MKKKTFRNSNYKGYKIVAKLIDNKWYIYCNYETQDELHLCYVDQYGSWNCIMFPEIAKDTSRMFDYTVSIYNAEVFGE